MSTWQLQLSRSVWHVGVHAAGQGPVRGCAAALSMDRRGSPSSKSRSRIVGIPRFLARISCLIADVGSIRYRDVDPDRSLTRCKMMPVRLSAPHFSESKTRFPCIARQRLVLSCAKSLGLLLPVSERLCHGHGDPALDAASHFQTLLLFCQMESRAQGFYPFYDEDDDDNNSKHFPAPPPFECWLEIRSVSIEAPLHAAAEAP